MKATVVVTITFADDFIEHRARARQVEPDIIARQLALEAECLLADACRWHDGVERVQSTVHMDVNANDGNRSEPFGTARTEAR